MANIGDIHLSNIIQYGDLTSVIHENIDVSFYKSPLNKQLFKFILAHSKVPEHIGEVPSKEIVLRSFPNFHYTPTSDSMESISLKLRNRKMQTDIRLMSEEAIELAEENPIAAKELLRSKMALLENLETRNHDVDLAVSVEGFLARMDAVSDSGGLIGLPYPWEILNKETMGMKNGEFIIFYGRPKSKKTWILLNCALHAYAAANARVLFYTREMTEEDILRRSYCIMTRSNYSDFKSWSLQSSIKNGVRRFLKTMITDEEIILRGTGKRKQFIITCDKMNPDGGSVDSIRATIEKYKPDIVFVDAMYLLRDSRSKSRSVDWKNMYHISQDLKHTAQFYDIPIVGTNQAKQSASQTRGEDLTEQAFADAFNMDCDLVARTIPGKCPETGMPEITLAFPGMREGTLEAFVIDGTPATSGFAFKRQAQFDDVAAAVEEDIRNNQSKARAKREEGKARLGSRYST